MILKSCQLLDIDAKATCFQYTLRIFVSVAGEVVKWSVLFMVSPKVKLKPVPVDADIMLVPFRAIVLVVESLPNV